MAHGGIKVEKVLRITKPNGEAVYYDSFDFCDFEFRNGFMMVSLNGLCGFIDVMGNEICPLQYEDLDDFSEERAGVCRDGLWTFIDTSGREIAKPEYDNVEIFMNGYAKVEKDTKVGFINRDGNKICDVCFDDAEFFEDGYVKVRIGNRWGNMNENGEVEWEEPEFPYEM